MGKFTIENFNSRFEQNAERLRHDVLDGEMTEEALVNQMRFEMVRALEEHFGIMPLIDLTRDQMLEVVEFISKLDETSPYRLVLMELVNQWSEGKPDRINLKDYL